MRIGQGEDDEEEAGSVLLSDRWNDDTDYPLTFKKYAIVTQRRHSRDRGAGLGLRTFPRYSSVVLGHLTNLESLECLPLFMAAE